MNKFWDQYFKSLLRFTVQSIVGKRQKYNHNANQLYNLDRFSWMDYKPERAHLVPRP